MLLTKIVSDPAIYPRQSLNHAHVSDLLNALLAGEHFPPLIVDRASKRLIDGWHRFHAYQRFGQDDVEVEEREYANEEELWLAAVAANANHGLKYSTYDRTRILVEAEKRGIERFRVTALIHLPEQTASKQFDTRTAFVKTPAGQPYRVPLRTALKPLAGHTLTHSQIEANKHQGVPISKLVTDLVVMLKAGVYSWCTDNEREQLKQLDRVLHRIVT